MRHLPLIARSACAGLLACVLLAGWPASTGPSAAVPVSTAVWVQAVNSHTGAVREAVADYPWSEQMHDHQQRADSEGSRSSRRDPGSGGPRSDAPELTRNPSGPVDCAQVKCVALTYDDGPVPPTEEILTALAEVNGRATFFVSGEMAQARPDVLRATAEQGHEIGNHGWSHTDFTELTAAEHAEEIRRTAEAVQAATGQRPTLVRPPFGSTSREVNAAAGGPVILWNTDSEDWRHHDAHRTHSTVMQRVEPGSIVLLHDLQPTTADATPALLRDLLAQGYHLVTVSEILGHSGQPGQVYQSGLAPDGATLDDPLAEN